MKKKLFVFFSFVLLASLVFISCNTDEQDGLTVGFANESGTGGNPDNTSAGTTGGGTTSTTVGSTSTTGGPFLTTSGSTTSGSTTSTTSTTSSTSGSTTSPPPSGDYFQVNSTVYTCTSVTGGIWNSSWSIIGRSAAGDTCSVSFNSIPAAATYPHTPNLFPANNECLVAVNINNSTVVYLGDVGDAVITIPSGSSRKVVITNMTITNLTGGADGVLNASMTAP